MTAQDSDSPTILPAAAPSRLEALIFTDIVDSSGIKSRLGTIIYTDHLQRHNTLFQEAIGLCPQAVIVKHTGDGFLARFPTASEAVRCMLRFQRMLVREAWSAEPIAARIGIHLGEVAIVRMADRTDIVGSPADVCARIMSIGAGGQILVSAVAADEARRFITDAVRWTCHGRYMLKGEERPVEIWEVANAATKCLPAPAGKVPPTAELPSIEPGGGRASMDSIGEGKTLESLPDHSKFLKEPFEGYEIIKELHHGGQGIVYQAIQKSTKRKVAVKVLLEGPYASKSARRRFEREIELVAQLKHPHIVEVFHSGHTADGRQFCVMDYIRGVPLDHYVREKKLALEPALVLFAKVCDAVNYAHQRGVIHRDLKPSNILVDTDGNPKVLDFGLAKQLAGPEQSLVSLTGQVVGTLPYMSPEQARGNPDEIDIRTDVYSLGIMLYEVLTGQYPYPVAGHMADVLKHIAETPPTPPSRTWKSGTGITQRTARRFRMGACPIDNEVQTIVMHSLTKERDRRYQSAGELGRDIGHYLADEPIEAKKDNPFYALGKALRRHKWHATVVTLALLAAALSLASLWKYDRLRRVNRRAHVEALLNADWSTDKDEVKELYEGFISRLKDGTATEEQRKLYLSNGVHLEIETRAIAALDAPLAVGLRCIGRPTFPSCPLEVNFQATCSLAEREVGTCGGVYLGIGPGVGSGTGITTNGNLAEVLSNLDVPRQYDLTVTASLAFHLENVPDVTKRYEEKPPIWIDRKVERRRVNVLRSFPESYPFVVADANVVERVEKAFAMEELAVGKESFWCDVHLSMSSATLGIHGCA